MSKQRPLLPWLGVGLALVFGLGMSGSVALLDEEPGNDDRFSSPTTLARAASLRTAVGRFELQDSTLCSDLGFCDLDFVRLTGLRAGDMVLAATTLRGDLLLDEPDTLLGLFDDDGFLVAIEPDLELASRLGFVVPADGDYSLGVTGTFDDLFIGDHLELGPYELSVALLPSPASGETLADVEPANDAWDTTTVAIDREDQPAVFAGGFTLGTPVGCPDTGLCDVDFVRVRGLQGGDLLTISTFPVGGPGDEEPEAPDTQVGVFDASGVLQDFEIGTEAGSRFDFQVPPGEPGDYLVAVTGDLDDDFLGDHVATGPYALMISVFPAPEPGGTSATLAVLLALRALASRGGPRRPTLRPVSIS